MTERRLLDVASAAAYLSLAGDTIRELDASGRLPGARVQLPGVRRVLFDREALDRLVAGWRAQP